MDSVKADKESFSLKECPNSCGEEWLELKQKARDLLAWKGIGQKRKVPNQLKSEKAYPETEGGALRSVYILFPKSLADT